MQNYCFETVRSRTTFSGTKLNGQLVTKSEIIAPNAGSGAFTLCSLRAKSVTYVSGTFCYTYVSGTDTENLAPQVGLEPRTYNLPASAPTRPAAERATG